jgi:hypothetical protein
MDGGLSVVCRYESDRRGATAPWVCPPPGQKKLKKARSGKAEVLSGRQWGGSLNNAEEMTACLREERPQAAPTPWASGLWCRDDYVTLIDDCYSSVEALERGSGWLG